MDIYFFNVYEILNEMIYVVIVSNLFICVGKKVVYGILIGVFLLLKVGGILMVVI